MTSNADILLKLIQGDEGKAWAEQHVGWKVSDSAKTEGMLCLPEKEIFFLKFICIYILLYFVLCLIRHYHPSLPFLWCVLSFRLTVHVCDWDYVDCDSTRTRILSIEATAAGLQATIPSELGQLPYLQRVILDNQNAGAAGLTGSIPKEFASLSNLVEVNLAFNNLIGPIPIFASAKLQTLNLSSNHLSGSLSTEFFYGSKGHGALLKLDLASNQLTGSLPDSIGQLDRMNTLSISDNQFSGK